MRRPCAEQVQLWDALGKANHGQRSAVIQGVGGRGEQTDRGVGAWGGGQWDCSVRDRVVVDTGHRTLVQTHRMRSSQSGLLRKTETLANNDVFILFYFLKKQSSSRSIGPGTGSAGPCSGRVFSQRESDLGPLASCLRASLPSPAPWSADASRAGLLAQSGRQGRAAGITAHVTKEGPAPSAGPSRGKAPWLALTQNWTPGGSLAPSRPSQGPLLSPHVSRGYPHPPPARLSTGPRIPQTSGPLHSLFLNRLHLLPGWSSGSHPSPQQSSEVTCWGAGEGLPAPPALNNSPPARAQRGCS